MTGQKNRYSTTEKLWNLDDKQLKSPEHDAMECWLMEEDNMRQLLKPLMEITEEKKFFSKQYNENDVIRDIVTIDSEVPISSSPTFIGGYADHIVKWKMDSCIEYCPCPIDSKWANLIEQAYYLSDMDILLQEYLNDKNYSMEQYCKDDAYYYSQGKRSKHDKIRWKKETAKYVDFLNNIGEDYPCFQTEIKNWIKSNKFYHKHKSGRLTCLIEVKPYIDSFGAVLRQIKTYKKFIEDTHGYHNHRRVNNFNIDKYCIFTLDDRFDKQFESQSIKVLHPPKDITIDNMRDMYGLW